MSRLRAVDTHQHAFVSTEEVVLDVLPGDEAVDHRSRWHVAVSKHVRRYEPSKVSGVSLGSGELAANVLCVEAGAVTFLHVDDRVGGLVLELLAQRDLGTGALDGGKLFVENHVELALRDTVTPVGDVGRKLAIGLEPNVHTQFNVLGTLKNSSRTSRVMSFMALIASMRPACTRTLATYLKRRKRKHSCYAVGRPTW